MFTKRWFSLVETSIILLIAWVILSMGFNYWYQYYQKVKEREAIEKVWNFFMDFDTANFTWKWFDKNRIKYQTMLIKNNLSDIDTYFYEEYFWVDEVTGKKDTSPKIRFYWMTTNEFNKEEITFKISEQEITNKNISLNPEENTEVVAIKRELPNNIVSVYSIMPWDFNQILVSNKALEKVFDIYWRWYINIYKSSEPNENNNMWFPTWRVLTSIWNLTIDVYYKNSKKIWNVTFDSAKKKIYFTNIYQEK